MCILILDVSLFEKKVKLYLIKLSLLNLNCGYSYFSERRGNFDLTNSVKLASKMLKNIQLKIKHQQEIKERNKAL